MFRSFAVNDLLAKLDRRGAHLLLFQLAIAASHFRFHLVDVEPLAHPQAFAARNRARTKLAPFRNGAFSCVIKTETTRTIALYTATISR